MLTDIGFPAVKGARSPLVESAFEYGSRRGVWRLLRLFEERKIVIGILAGLLVCAGVLFNDRVLKVDDPCGAISVHGYCGWLGAVCVGIFADGVYGAGWNGVGATTYLGQAGLGVTGLLHGDKSQFICQLFGATLCAAYAFGGTYAVFSVVNAIKPLRVTPEVELEGLDIPQFGGLAYPEDALAAAE